MVLPAAFLLLAVAASALGQDTQDDCAVRAYVRAADLSQNKISHGELRVKLVGSACAPLARVGLRLTLDEYAQSAPLPKEQDGFRFSFWEFGMGNFTVAGAANATLQERAFTTGVTWDVQGQSFDRDEGLIKPFSVAMPDVQYPTGIFPFKFTCSSEDEKTGFGFGRVYRYFAWVVLEGGKELGAPAGYTSFAIDPVNFDKNSATISPDGPINDPGAKEVEMVLYVPQVESSFRQRMLGAANAAKDSQKDDFPSSIALKITFPQGNLVVPGEDLKFILELIEPEPADTKTEVTLILEAPAHILGDRPLLRDAKCSGSMWRKGSFNALRSSNSEGSDDGNGRYFSKSMRSGEATVVTLNISPDTAIDSPGAFFASKIQLNMHIIRRHRASMFAPGHLSFGDYQHIPKDYVQDGQSSESGPWALDFDRRLDSAESYEHRIELPLAKLKSIGLTYHEALGSTEQPVMAPGHVQTREEAEDTGARFAFKLKGRLDIPGDLDSFVGQYVGMLWKAHEQNITVVHTTQPQVVDAGGSAGGITEQIVFG